MNNSSLLTRVFSKKTFQEIIRDGESDTYNHAVERYISHNIKLTNKDYIRRMYDILKKNYRNEYYYKNTLLNKLLLGVHSVKTTTALTELPVDKSIADFILINGKAVVYEIKTDLDNFDRLDSQIADYYKAFSRVVVVTSENNFIPLTKILEGSPVGIYVLTKRGQLSLRKPPVEDKMNLSSRVMFKILRKKEYEEIIIQEYGKLPNVSDFEYYSKNEELFCRLSVNKAYELFIKMLKKRGANAGEVLRSIPTEISFIVYFSMYNKNAYKKLNNFLNQ